MDLRVGGIWSGIVRVRGGIGVFGGGEVVIELWEGWAKEYYVSLKK